MTKKKILALILSILMVLEVMPISALAEIITSNTLEGADYAEVTFMDGSTAISSQLLEDGATLVLPEKPSKSGYVFKDWRLGTTTGEVVTEETTLEAGSKYTVVANYTAIETYKVVVEYYSAEGGEEVLDPTIRYYGNTETEIDEIDVPEYVIYEGAKRYTAQPTITIDPTQLTDEVTTFRVYYDADPISVTVHHMKQVVKDNTAQTDASGKPVFKEDTSLQEIVAVAPNRYYEGTAKPITGYRFDSAPGGKATLDNHDFYVYYQVKTFNLYYDDSTGGSHVASKLDIPYGSTVTVYTGGKVLECTKEEHTHTLPSETASETSSLKSGCYKKVVTSHTETVEDGTETKYWIQWTGAWTGHVYQFFPYQVKKYKDVTINTYSWELACGKDEHTHTSDCYSATVKYDPEPTYHNFVFDGWYADQSLTSVADKTIPSMTQDVTVYAKWSVQKANYTIAYYKEKYNNKTGRTYYVYLGDDGGGKAAEVGTTVTASGYYSAFEKDSEYPYYVSTPVYESAVVKWDGSTVVGAYYKLKRYHITFDLDNSNARMIINGQTYKGTEYQLSDVVLGQDISAYWPSYENIPSFTLSEQGHSTTVVYEAWEGNWVTKRYEVTEDMLSSRTTDLTYTCSYQESDDLEYVRYWLQSADGKSYAYEDRYCQTLINTNLGPKDLYGFECAYETTAPSGTDPKTGKSYPSTGKKTITNAPVTFTGYVYEFYYNRSQYTITFKAKDYGENGTWKTADTQTHYFGADISGYKNYKLNPSDYNTPTSDYTFGGWYDNDDCAGEPFDFDNINMPAGNLVLYARFDPPNRNVQVKFEIVGKEDKSFNVPYGDCLADQMPEDPSVDGYTFVRWYTLDDAGNKHTYDKYANVYEDTIIYAEWRSLYSDLTINYVDADTGAALLESKTSYNHIHLEKVTVDYELIPGYRPDASSKYIEIDAYQDNVINFYYTKGTESIQYTVKYLQYGTDTAVATAVTKDSGKGVYRVVEFAPAISGYYPMQDEISHVLVTKENVITFYYVPYSEVTAKVKFYINDELVDTKTLSKSFKISYTVRPSDYETEQDAFEAAHTNVSLVETSSTLRKTARAAGEVLELELKYYQAANYKVQYYFEGLDGNYSCGKEESTKGAVGSTVTAKAKKFTGFTYDSSNKSNKLSGTVSDDGSLVLKLYYTRNSYTVSYSYSITAPAGASTLPADATVKYGATVSVAAAATASGYDFSGWSTEDATVSGGSFEMPAKNVAFSGYFTAGKETAYKVQHWFQNVAQTDYVMDATVDMLTGETGTSTAAEARTVDGFTAGTVTQSTISADGKTVVKIYYTRKSYNLIFKVDGTEVSNVSYVYGATTSTPADPTAPTGYKFGGWNETIPATMPAKDVTITGSYVAGEVKYTIEYYQMNLKGEYSKYYTSTGKGTTGETTNVTAEARTGFTLVEPIEQQVIAAEGTTVVKVYYERNKHEVVFTVDGKQYGDPIEVYYGDTIPYDNNMQKEGYTWNGWTPIKTTMPDEPLTITGSYTVNEYTVSYYVDGELYGEKDTVAYGSTIPERTLPTKAGYHFSGWDETVPASMPAEDLIFKGSFIANDDTPYDVQHYWMDLGATTYTLHETETLKGTTGQATAAAAKSYEGFYALDFSQKTIVAETTNPKVERTVVMIYYMRSSYKLTYQVDGKNWETPVSYEYGATLPAAPTPTKTGYTFSGWDAETPATMPAEALTISGSFTVNSHNVSYELDGEAYGSSVSYDYGTNVKLADDVKKAGYTFSGWSTDDATVSGKTFSMPDNDVVLSGTLTADTVNYTVKHHKQNLDDPTAYTLADTETKSGTTDTQTAAAAKSYDGFEAQTFEQTNIGGDGKTVVDIYYNRISYKLTVEYEYQDGTTAATKVEETKVYGASYSVTSPTISGYTPDTATVSGTMPAKDTAVTVVYSPNGDTPYTVIHHYEDLNADTYSTTESESKTGVTGAKTAAVAKTVTGFSAQTFEQQTISGDGDTVVDIYYSRQSYQLKYQLDGEDYGTPETHEYGDAITEWAEPTKDGYTFGGWKNVPETMPGEDTVITGTFTADKVAYKVEHYTENLNWTSEEDKWDLYATEDDLEGETDTQTAAEAQEITGFTAAEFSQLTISGKGDTVVKIYYNRNEYTVTYMVDGEKYTSTKEYYGDTVATTSAPTRIGYSFDGWESDDVTISENKTFTMPAEDITISGSFSAAKVSYTVVHELQVGTSDKYNEKERITNCQGTTGEKTEAEAKEYTGFTAQTITQETIKADGTTTVHVRYNRNSYTVKYELDGQAYGTDAKYVYEATVTLAAAPSKQEGKTFSGWSTEDATISGKTFTMPAKDVTIVGSFSANSYKVSYFVDGEAYGEVSSYDYGSTVEAIAKPTKTGYTLSDWASDEVTIGTDGKFTMPAKDVVFSASYSADTVNYTVKHYQESLNGEYDLVTADTETKSGTTDTQTEASAKSYTGFTAQAFDQLTIAGDGTTVVEIYYDRNEITLSFKKESEDTTDYATRTGKYGADVSEVTDPEKEGYTFKGWNEVGGKVPATFPTEDKTYVAVWEINSYDVSYSFTGTVPFGATAEPTTESKEYNSTVTVADAASATGYTFSGWTTTDATVSEGSFTMPAKAVSFTGYFTANTGTAYTVKHSFQNVAGTAYEVDESKTQNLKGTTGAQTEAAALTVDGFTAQSFSQATIAADGTTVVTVEYDRKEITLTFKKESEDTTDYATRTGDYGTDVEDVTDPTKEGYTFKGWNEEDGTIPETFPTENATYVAVWEINSYDVSYSFEGTVPEEASDAPATASKEYNSTVTVADAATAEGYTFSGWTTSDATVSEGSFTMPAKAVSFTGMFFPKDGTGYVVKHAFQNVAGTEYVVDETKTESKTGTTGAQTAAEALSVDGFTAQTVTQAKISGKGTTVVTVYYDRNTVTLTFKKESTDTTAYETRSGKYGADVTVVSNPTKEGYTFKGWNEENGVAPSTFPTTDTTYVAVWKVNSYNVSYYVDGAAYGDVSSYDYGSTVTAKTKPTKAGYTLSDWASDEVTIGTDGKFTMPAEDVVFNASYSADTVNYTVKHYQESLKGEYVLVTADTETKSGTTDTQTEASANSYTGFTAQAFDQKTIAGDGSTVVEIKYSRNSYELKIGYQYEDETEAQPTYTVNVLYGDDYSVDTPAITGYHADVETVSGTMDENGYTTTVTYAPNTDTKYTVKYYLQDLGADTYTWKEDVEASGTTGETTAVTADKSYTGFTAPADKDIEQKTIAADGTTVVEVKYTRNSYNVSYKYTGNVPEGAADLPETASYQYGATVDLASKPSVAGYSFTGWTSDVTITVSSNQFTMPASAVELSGYFTAITVNYTVKHLLEDVDGEGYTVDEDSTEVLQGITGQDTEAAVKSFTGFTAPETVEQKTILGNGTTVVEIKYTRNSYDVSYAYSKTVPGASELPTKASYKYEETVTVADDAEAAGYSFSGWSTDKATIESGKFTMPAENVTLSGSFTAETVNYTVEHYLQNLADENYPETAGETETLQGTTGEQTAAVIKTYTGFTSPASVTQETIKGDGTTVIKLYYTRNSYKVSYAYAETVPGASELPTQASYKYGAEVTVAADAEAAGYSFSGWSTDKATIESGKFTMPAENVTLTGSFTAVEVNYTVEHYLQNLADESYPETASETETLQGVTGEQTAAVIKTYTGFTSPKTVTQQTIKGDGTTTIKLFYTRNSYDVSYAYDEAVPGASELTPKATYKYGAEVTVEADAKADGYTFDGWKDDAELTISEGKFTMPAVNVTFTGSFTPATVQYTVEHYLQNLNDNNYPTTAEKTEKLDGVTEDETEAQVSEFTGFTAPTEVTQETIKGDGTTVIKLYYTRNSYEVSYAYDEEVPGASKLPSKVSYKYGAEVTVAADAKADGYTFDGWKDDAELTISEGKFTMPAANVTFTGSFTPTTVQYTVEHYLQNLNDNNYPTTAEKTEKLDGVTEATTEAQVSEFTGFTAPTEIAQETIKGDGTTVIKLYYTRNSYEVSYAYAEEVPGASELPKAATAKYGATVAVAEDAEAPGYSFDGWTDNASLAISEDDTFTMPAQDVAFTGSFTAVSVNYTVEHYLMNLDGRTYTLKSDATETLQGVTGTTTEAAAKTFTGFTAESFDQKTISGDGDTVIQIKYTRDQHNLTIHYVYEGGVAAFENYTATLYYDEAYSVASGEVKGYTATQATVAGNMGTADVEITVTYLAHATVYHVRHELQNLSDPTQYTLKETDELYGNTDSDTQAAAKSYAGFTAPEASEITVEKIKGDGTTVITIRYTRNSYTVNYAYQKTVPGASELPEETKYLFEQEVTVLTGTKAPGYSFSGWSADNADVEGGKFTMPAEDVLFTGSFTAIEVDYKVEYQLQNVADDNYTTDKVVTKQGVTGEKTEAEIEDYTGFTAPAKVEQLTISGDGTTVVVIKYTRKSYKVSYAYDATVPGASKLPAEAEVRFEASVTVESAATAPGYIFDGWETKDAEVAENSFTMPANDVTFTGSFTADTVNYKVIHYQEKLDGTGYVSADVETKQGVTGETTEAEVKDYEGFTAPTAQELANSQLTIDGNGETTVELYYKRNSYNVSYSYDEAVPGASELPKDASYKYGATVTLAEKATAPGYSFSGWTTDDVVLGETEFTMPAGNVTLSGSFTAIEVTYTVEHYLQNLDGASYTLNEDATDTLPGVTGTQTNAAQKNFIGFTAPAEVTQQTIDGDGTTVVKIYYTRNSYNVSYAYTNTVPGADELPLGGTYKFGATVSVAKAATAPGYDFSGWNTDKASISENSFTMPAEDVVLSGSFTAIEVTYTVEHYLQNAEDDEYTLNSDATETLNGVTGTQTAAAAKDFTGFTAPETIAQEAILGDGKTTIKIYYTRKLYQVSYSYTGYEPEDASALPIAAEYRYGASVTLAADAIAAGYSFSGWASEDASIENGKFTMPAQNVSITGSFTAIAVNYTVEHYLMNLNGEGYTLDTTETKSGVTGTETEAASKVYEGFTAQSFDQQTISGQGDTVVRIDYNRDRHNLVIRYVYEDGTTAFDDYTAELYYGTSYQVPSEAIVGYTATKSVVEGTVGTADTEVTVTYLAKATKYTVNHLLQDADDPESYATELTEELYGKTDTLTQAEAKDYTGFTAPEASEIEELQQKISGDGTTVINIRYTRNSYDVSYEYASTVPGASELPETKSYKYGVKVTVEEDAEAAGYRFSGWDADKAVISKGEFIMPAENVKLSGSFTAIKVNYTVEHYLQQLGSEEYELDDTQTLQGTTGTLTEASAKKLEGFTAQSFDQQTISGDGTTVIRIDYKRNSYKVNYLLDGAAYGEESDAQYEEVVTVEADPVKEGYYFSGWQSKQAVISNGKFTMPAKNVTVEGSFLPNDNTPYTVEYYYMDDEGNYPETTLVTKLYGGVSDTTAIATDADKTPSSDKYIFDDEAANILSGNIAPDGSLILKVYFRLNKVNVTIHHYLNGTTVKVADDDKFISVVGDEITLSAANPLYADYANASVAGYLHGTETMKVVAGTNEAIVYYKGKLTLTAQDDDKVYDSFALTNPGFSVSGLLNGDVATGFSADMTKASTITHVGKQANVVDLSTVLYNGAAVPAYYDVETVDGELEITPRSITLTSADATKVYDETALTNETVTVTDGGYAGTENFKITVTGSITYVGTAENSFTYKAEKGTDLADYDVKTVFGTLTVTEPSNNKDNPYRPVIKSHKDQTYAAGDKVSFTIDVTNVYNTAKTITVTEQAGVTLTGNSVFENVEPGAKVSTTAEYVITSDDILKGTFANEVSVAFDGAKTYTEKDIVELEPADVGYTITKMANLPAGKKFVSKGDVITYTVTVSNTGTVALKNLVVTDELTGDEWTIAELPAHGEPWTAETKGYTVTEEDLLNGKVSNTVTMTGDPIQPEGKDPTTPEQNYIEEIPTEEVKADYTFTKTSATKTAKLGDEITYTLTVKNTGNVTLKNITVKDELTGDEWTIAELGQGEVWTKNTKPYTVTEADILKGGVLNTATLQADDITPEGKDPIEVEKDQPLEIPTEEVKADYTFTKTSATKTAKLGDEITYTLTVKNTGNVTLKNITVKDELTGDEWTIAELGQGEVWTKNTKPYTVTEADILKGGVLNTATLQADDITPEGKDPIEVEKDQPLEIPTEEVKADYTFTKTSATKTAKLGEEITYTLTVKNTGNVTLKNITVKDELTGDEWTIAELGQGEVWTKNTKPYTVTSADILNGKVLNTATIEADEITPEGKDPIKPEGSTDNTVPTEAVNGNIAIEKVSNVAAGAKPAVGDKITYTITVKNTGNVPYTNVIVKDELTNDTWTIDTLEVGAEESFKVTVTVTSADVLKGSIANTATVIADPIQPVGKDPVTPKNEKTETTEVADVNSSMEVTKTSDAGNEIVKAGQVVNYTITVKNTGNVPYTNVIVKDEFAGKNWTIAELPVGKTETFKVAYTVTAQDLLKGSITNIATAEADSIPNPKGGKDLKPAAENKVINETENINTGLTVTKTSDKDGTTVKLGETITYTITVTNTGNVPYTNLVVKDELTGLTETIATLAVGEIKTLTTTYVVKEADLINGSILNNVTVAADGINDPKNPGKTLTPENNGENTLTTEEANADFTVVKRLTNLPARGYFQPGETANFTITVTNTGNLTLHTINIASLPAGIVILPGEGYHVEDDTIVIDSLAIEGKVVINISYDVTLGGIINGMPTVDCSASGKTPDSKTVNGTVSGDRIIPVDEVRQINGTISWNDGGDTSARASGVQLALYSGSTLHEERRIVITGDVTDYSFGYVLVHDSNGNTINYTVKAEDVEHYATTYSNVFDIIYNRKSLKLTVYYWYEKLGGETAYETFTGSYYAGSYYSVRSPRIEGYTADVERFTGTLLEDTVLNVVYQPNVGTLTIRYLKLDGTTAAPTYTKELKTDESYSVDSPVVDGYTATIATVSGKGKGKDEEYIVYYLGEDDTLIDDYNVPLGFGSTGNNAGLSCE